MDPAERQDCQSLLKHHYFDDFSEEFEEEINGLLQLDADEFQKNRLRQATKERIDENNILSPRSPAFASTLAKNHHTEHTTIGGNDFPYMLTNHNKVSQHNNICLEHNIT